jgi:hypothetical protein
MTFGGGIGSINFSAAGSGGPIIDFEATSEVDGGIAGGIVGVGEAAEDAGVGPGSALEATMGGFSTVAAALGATGGTTGAGAGFCALAGVSLAWVDAAAAEAVGAAAGPGGAAAAVAETVLDEVTFWAAALCAVFRGITLAEAASAPVGEDGSGGFCREIAPVTESRPCSRTPIRA